MVRRQLCLLTRERPSLHFDDDPLPEAMANLRAMVADTTDGHEIKPPKQPRSY